MRRVVVTGLGLITPLAANVKDSWNKLIESKSGIRKITRFDVSDINCKVAGEILDASYENGFDPNIYMSEREQGRIDKFIIYGIAAAEQAIEDSGWKPVTDYDCEMTGVMIGSGIGGLPSIETNSILLHEQGPKKISPFFIPASLINLVSGNVSIKHNYRGPNHAVVTACSTGAHAIGDAARMIALGDANVIVAGGTESALCRIGMVGFAQARALSTNFNDTPNLASRPWDRDRDGFVMGEGAGIVVLEEYEHAKARGANIYAEIIGYGLTGDAYHITAPHPTGDGAYRSMQMALRKANISPDQIDYINAHGTSTPLGDKLELEAVQKIFGYDNKKISMSSTKSSIGHLLGAAGSVEAIFCIPAMKNNIAPPTLNLDNPISEATIDLVPKIAKDKQINYILSNSFGFGGTNASLVMKKFDE